jgi:hypothetical protein
MRPENLPAGIARNDRIAIACRKRPAKIYLRIIRRRRAGRPAVPAKIPDATPQTQSQISTKKRAPGVFPSWQRFAVYLPIPFHGMIACVESLPRN